MLFLNEIITIKGYLIIFLISVNQLFLFMFDTRENMDLDSKA